MKKLTSIFLALAIFFNFVPINIFATKAENMVVDETTGVIRYTVLAMDTSGSMSGIPMATAKAAAIKFCEGILKANGKNYLALITLNSSSSVVCNFTDDIDSIKSKINNLSASGGTNVNDALVDANAMLSKLTGNNIIKNIVILSDGLPESGNTSYNGPYTSSDYYDYEYANPAYHNAQEFKKTNYIYTLGFFHKLDGSELTFGRKFMSDLQNEGYFDVTNLDDLEFVFGNIAENITNKAKAGTFSFASPFDTERDHTATYYYNDNYFIQDSTLSNINHSLATMSLCLALSAYNSNAGGDNDYSNKFKNVKNLLCDELGFDKFQHNCWFAKKPTSESIGVVAAQKKIKDEDEIYTLIAVAVRGGNYESEWASNFTIGTSGQASGFANAKNQVIDFIKDYISNEANQISGKIKLWIVGYSRGAATSNLVAGAIDDNLQMFGSNVSLDKNDLFAYCFETPMGALNSEKKTVEDFDPTRYNNIWNIVNKNDPVTKVAMSELGFTRYGRDHYLPDRLTCDYDEYIVWQERMIEYYEEMSSCCVTGEYIIDDFKMVDLRYILPGGNSPIVNDKNNMTQGAFLDEAISKLTTEAIRSRTNYVNEFQNGIRVIVTSIYGTLFEGYDKGDVGKFFSLFVNRITDLDVLCNLLLKAITNPKEVDDVIENVVTECLNECGMNNINPLVLADFVGAVAKLVVQFGACHPNLTATLIYNKDSMGAAHYPELCLAWLMAEDKNYTIDPVEFNGTGSYRVIRINCPVDVEVYGADGSLVAKIAEDIPQLVPNSSIVSSINEDGEKLVFLPITSEYSIKMNATADGEVNYSVSEFSDDAGENNRVLNYFNINVNAGDTLTGSVPAYSDDEIENGTPEGSSVVYELCDTEDNFLQADSDLSGDEATDAYFMVSVSSNNDEFGVVSGQGTRQIGNFAQLEAIPYDGYNFVGWYKNDELLSTNTTYRFAVTEDVSIVGKFSDGTNNVITFDKSNITLILDDTNKSTILNIIVSPSDAEIPEIIWDNSNDSVVDIAFFDDKSKVGIIGLSEGTSTITATTKDGAFVGTCIVTVKKEGYIPITGLIFDKEFINLNIDGEQKSAIINVTIFPENTNVDIVWESSNEAVADIAFFEDDRSKAIIVGKVEGNSIITATVEGIDGYYIARCTVTVRDNNPHNDIPVTGITLDVTKTVLILKESNDRIVLNATISPDNATNGEIIWTNSNDSVVAMRSWIGYGSSVAIEAIAEGVAEITATTADGNFSATCLITVINDETSDGSGNLEYEYLYDGTCYVMGIGSCTDTDIVIPSTHHEMDVVGIGYGAFSSNSDITSITIPQSVTVIGVDAFNSCNSLETIYYNGTPSMWAQIGIHSGNTVLNSAEIIFTSNESVTGISLNKSSTTLDIGETVSLTATVSPSNATNKTVTWKSSDTTVATVSDGVVTAVSAGTATITAKTTDGEKTATCVVTVPIPEEEITYTSDHLVDLRKAVAGLITPDEETAKILDLNQDGELSSDDLILLRKKIAGLI